MVLAQAMVPRLQVMLMEELFPGVVQRLREIAREETLALLKETRAACVLVTHDPVEAMDLEDGIFLMQAGRSIQSGGPAELFRKPADFNVARLFSDVNEHSGRVTSGEVETPLGRFAASGFATAEEAVGYSAAAGPRPFWARARHGGAGA